MKTFFRYSIKLVAVPLLCLLASCDELLDVTPADSILLADAYATADAVEGQLLGAYANLQAVGLYGTNTIMGPDLFISTGTSAASGRYLDWRGTFASYSEMNRQDMVPNNADALNCWREGYRIINRANLVLANLGVVTDAAQSTRIAAEARFLRGIAHFELVKLYGRPYNGPTSNPATDLGIIVTTTAPPLGTDAIFSAPPRPRGTVEEAYDQAIADLIFARDNLENTNAAGGLEQAFRANSLTASAFLARIYLQQGLYNLAGAEAERVIESGLFELLPDPIDPFLNPNSLEAIFELQQNTVSNAGTNNGGLATFHTSTGRGGRGDSRVGTRFAAAAAYDSTTDKRVAESSGGFFYRSGSGTLTNSNIYCAKWGNPTANYNIIRLAEMYLVRAECTFRGFTGASATALADVNAIRDRSNAPDLTTLTLTDILLERARELCFEGQEFCTMNRVGGDYYLRGLTTANNTIDGIAVGARQMLFPIPQRELDLNSALVQNQ
jgi:starch-binding outer membrane protein, SusD/RagB family